MVSEPFAGNQIDRNSPVPLFLQIRQALLADIRSWPDTAAQFPTDLALAQRFSVSKMTVRQAIDDLVEAGLLERHRGRGTFVTDRAFVEQLDPVLDIDQQYAAAGHSQTTRVLSFDRRPMKRLFIFAGYDPPTACHWPWTSVLCPPPLPIRRISPLIMQYNRSLRGYGARFLWPALSGK